MPQQEYEVVTGIVITIIVFLLAGFFILVLVAYINQRKKRHIEEKKSMQVNFNQELLRTQLEIQEQTLKTISQEIHDNIGQVLSLAKLNLATADISKMDTLSQKIEDSRSLVAKAIQDLRDLSKSMNTDYVSDMGLPRSIEYELEMIKKTGYYETEFDIEGSVYPLERKKELILFRIVQEVLNNIIKHARATRIILSLHYEPASLDVKITDNGHGFDLTMIQGKNEVKAGLGIKNMNNRAQLIGAQFLMRSTLEQGTIVDIHVPTPGQPIQ
jgi:two-component system NarL family sensor kinase